MVEAATREALLERIWELAERAVGGWPLARPVVKLLEHKKNVTFKVEAAAQRYVLRVCDPDGYGEAEIRSELEYLLALGKATGLVVPEPVRARDGSLVVRAQVEGLAQPRWCALFRWVPGRMVADAPAPRRLEQVGEIAGRLHRFAQGWLPPAGFSRPRWDAAGLFGNGPVVAPGQGAPLLSERSRELLEEAAGVVRAVMAELGQGGEVFGLIHKDLEPDNTLIDGERVHAIDFADFGWGYYLYDMAAALLPLREKPGFAAMREAFLRGYGRVRPLADEQVELLETFFIARGIFSVRLMTGKLWDLPRIRVYAETAVPQILGAIRIFLERRHGRSGEAASTRTTVQVLSLLRSRGVKLWAEGEKLRYSAPPGALPAEIVAELKERKEELLGFLRQGYVARRSGAPSRIEAARREAAPLSFAQQRLWFLHQLLPDGAEYNIARAVRLRGRVRVELLAASLREIVRRHGSLRTTFAVEDGQPVQVVAELEVAMPLVDLAALPAERREAEAWRLAREDAGRPFDLARGPLLRVFLLRLEAEDFIAPSTMHHVIGDGWSSGILFREMGMVYEALARGAAPALPSLPVQYVDFAVWQRQWLSGEVLEEQLAYWKQQLSGAAQELDLPTDRPRSGLRTASGDRRTLLIPRPLADSLREFSQAQGATLFMILLAAWKTLLCRVSGQDDIVVGSPIANRNRAEIEGLIGCFINTLVLRTVLSGNPAFREVLAAVRRTTLGAYAHQDLPFEKLVEELHPERSLTQTPLFQVVFTLQNVPSPDMEVADFRMTLMPPTGRAATFDLTCNLKEMPEGIRTSLMYKQELFDGTTVERLGACYLRLLAAVAEDPSQGIRELPLLSAAEAQQLLEWGRARVEPAEGDTLPALFEARVRQAPGARAVTCEGGELTYGELNARANRLAHRLRQLGVGPEVRVGLCVERSLDLVVGVLGIVKAGGAYLPLDPGYPRERLTFLLEDSGAQVVVGTEETLVELSLSGTAVHLDGPELEGCPEDDPPAVAEAGNAAYVIYTSGSTGRPKGVVVTQANVLRLFQATEPWFGFGPEDVWTLFHSYAFDFSVWEIWGALLHGGRLVVVPWAVSRTPAAFHDLLAGERVTVLNQTPTAFAELQRVDEDPARGGALSALRLVIFGGEALVASRLAGWFVRHGASRPRLVNMYGITETTVHVTYRQLTGREEGSGIGIPIPDLAVHVLDAFGHLSPIGVPGELAVGGAGLARGYLGRPDLTAERFVPDPSSGRTSPSGSRLYRSGDLGRFLPTGELEYLGRIDHQVKIRGFRVEPGEIEAALLAHPEVQEAVVLARVDEGGGGRLVAFFVPRPERSPEASELRRHLLGTLPEHQVPASCVQLGALPRTANGKVDRKALLALDEAPRPGEAFVAPRTPAEALVAGIFAEVLKLEAVGAEADFFELGGHSLLATQVMSRVRQALGVELPLRSLFASPTVADLAREVAALRRDGEETVLPPITRGRRGPTAPLSFAQERLWFLHRFAPQSDAYNVSLALAFDGGLRWDVAARALTEIVRRHEVLRTVVVEDEGGPMQRVAVAAAVPLPVCDLSGLPPELREREARRLAAVEARRPFDLARGPVLRALLVRLAERRHAAALTLHHIATDGWSTGILVREFCALYRAFAMGETSPLAELPVQYADYAAWQRRWLDGPALERQLAYWRQRLGVDPPPLDLPADRPRSRDRVWGGAVRRFVLESALAGNLNRFSRQRSVSLFMTLLAAWKALLGRVSGQAVIRVGTPVANRRAVEIEELIGLFVNTLVLATDMGGSPSFAELLGRVRESCLEAQDHQDAPFDRLVEELVRERDLSRSPLFQVLFVLQNAPGASAELPDLVLTHLPGEAGSAQFDLSLQLEEGSAGLSAQLDYSTDLFDAATVERLAGQFQALLAAAVASPDAGVSELPLLPAAEAQQLLEWGGVKAAPAEGGTLAALFEARVRQAPGARAVTCEDRELTYGELNARANRLAHCLRQLGVGPEVRVGLCVERSLDLVVGALGIVKAGGAYLPLDPGYPRERLTFLVEDAGAPVVVGTEEVLAELSLGGTAVHLDGPELEGCPEDDPPAVAEAGNAAYVIYTSGSTGRPKGVVVTQANVIRLFQATEPWFGFGPEDVWTLFHSYAFDFSVWEIWGALLHGGRLVVVPWAVSRTPAAFHDLLVGERVTVLNQTPTAFAELQRIDEDPARSGALAALRLVIFGGEALAASRLAGWIARHGEARPRLVNMYGITETTVHVTYRQLAGLDEESGIGIPIPDLAVHVLDGFGRLAPIGVPGELAVGGAGLTRGYLGRPELTAERFVPDPFCAGTEPGARLYRSGDLGRFLPSGELEYLGRIDHQLKIRGFRVEPGEIEAALLAHPEVQQAVVLWRGEEPGNGRLVAFVVPGPEHLSELRNLLHRTLPDHQVPASFVRLDAVPLTANGKVDRKVLLALDATPRPEEGFVAPRTQAEELVAGIFAEVLKLEAVGADGHFFELGGHSLLATQVVSRVRQALGVELPLRSLFTSPVAADLAREVEEMRRAGGGPALPPIHRGARGVAVPLSFSQERLWFLYCFAPQSDAYHVSLALGLDGGLRCGVAADALTEIVWRHEVLRTVIVETDGAPVQGIGAATALPLPVCDLSGLPVDRREPEARHLAALEASRPFDLVRGPVLRALLVRLAERRHAATLTLHHIATDGWSMGVLVREFCALYRAFAMGEPSPLAELPVQYADYAAWQRRWLDGPALERQLAYWRQRLGVDPPPLDLPADRLRSRDRVWGGAVRRFVLSPAVAERLNRFSRQRSVSLFMTLLAAWKALLGRVSGQAVIRVGTPVANRRGVEIEELIGLFVNTLVLATDIGGAPSFAELLGRVRETCLEAQDHQDAPFDRLVEELVRERDLSRSPLFQVLFVLQNAPGASAELPDLVLTHLPGEVASAMFDLSLQLEEGPAGLSARLDYSTDLFDAATVERLARHFQTLLAAAVAAPERGTAELPLLSAAEVRQLAEWGGGQVEHEVEDPLPALFEAQARKAPGALAVACEGSELTFGELNARANRLAHFLRQLGVGPEVKVGLCVERSLELAVGVLGILKAGGVYLPLDPNYPRERLAFLIEDSGAPVLVGTAGTVANLPVPPEGIVVCLDGTAAEALERCPQTDPPAVTEADNGAYVIYTSGSTGRPKGVPVTHANLAAVLAASRRRFDWRPGDRMPCLAPASFDIFFFELLGPLSAGATSVLFPLRPALDLEHLAATLEQMTALHAVPAVMRQLIDEIRRRGDVGRHPRLRTVFVGGDAVPADLLADMGEVFPEAQVWVLYGPTEATIICSSHAVAAGESKVRIGRPLDGARLLVRDAEGSQVPIGVRGEIWIGGAGIARGYLNQDGLTREKFVTVEGERFYRSGDLARWHSDGNLEFLGRTDQQLKVRGFRIEPGEIEAVLAHHPDVAEAVVVVQEDPSRGRRLVAYVVLTAGPLSPGPALVAGLRDHVRASLPDYMVPAAFVPLAALPLSPNGKVDRRALPEPELHLEPAGDYQAPETPVEEAIAAVWSETLGRERIGRRDSFFELGGHSLLAARAVSRLRRVLGFEVPLRTLFESPVLADLAAVCERSLRGGAMTEAPPIEPVRRDLPSPLSFAQERLWFLDQLSPGGSAYNSAGAVRLRGPLETGTLARTLREIARRHEVLRTSYPEVDGSPVQRISPPADLPLPLVDLSALAADGREREARQQIAAAARRPFDLARGPVLRALLLRLHPEEHAAVFILHHIACDGWSMSVLLREIAALYSAFREGRPSPLAELPVQYADFAFWQRRRLQGEALEEGLAWWRMALGGNPEPLRLPADRQRPARPSERGAWRSFRLDPELSRSLAALSRREGATLFMCLLAVFDVLLFRTTGQEDIVVGTAIANRGRIETEGLIGFFIEMLPTRVDLSGNPRFSELLRRVQQVALGVFAHQDCPIERLMDEMRPEAGGEVSPFFRIAFGVRNTPSGELEIPGLEVLPIRLEQETVRFDATVWVTETSGGLEITWRFRSELFEEATIERLNRGYEALLGSVAADPKARIGSLEMFSAEEKQRRVREALAWRESQAGKLGGRRRKAVGGAA